MVLPWEDYPPGILGLLFVPVKLFTAVQPLAVKRLVSGMGCVGMPQRLGTDAVTAKEGRDS